MSGYGNPYSPVLAKAGIGSTPPKGTEFKTKMDIHYFGEVQRLGI